MPPHTDHHMTDRPTLLFLAAGLGSRYGGAKQLEPVGPAGETLMDYGVYDALRAGFGRFVFIIRPELEAEFESTIAARYRHRVPVQVVLQRPDDLPAGVPPQQPRRKPWGTGQALLAARNVIDGPFGVLNADDFYGLPALTALAQFLDQKSEISEESWAVVGYPLARTLSAEGPVNRAFCRVGPGGWLQGLVEVRNIVSDGQGGGVGVVEGTSIALRGSDPVSMNLWGFTPSLFDALHRGFSAFLASVPPSDAEYYLPEAVAAEIAAGRARTRLLETDSPWCGLSHPADRPAVESFIRRMIQDGIYPESLPR